MNTEIEVAVVTKEAYDEKAAGILEEAMMDEHVPMEAKLGYMLLTAKILHSMRKALFAKEEEHDNE
jgi:hypothetical protein